MIKLYFLIFIFLNSLNIYCSSTSSNSFISIARVKYKGGGDWYNDPSIIPALLKYFNKVTNIKTAKKQYIVSLDEKELFDFPIIYLTGHGNISFSDIEIENLRTYLKNGGFLYADDDLGMDKAFRREIKKVFPKLEFIELSSSYKIYSCFFQLKGLPKIHEHEKGRPIGLGLFLNGRLCIYYTYNTNISDGWGDYELHHDSDKMRELAFKMGVNILIWALIQ